MSNIISPGNVWLVKCMHSCTPLFVVAAPGALGAGGLRGAFLACGLVAEGDVDVEAGEDSNSFFCYGQHILTRKQDGRIN